jgi:hypothetical protein
MAVDICSLYTGQELIEDFKGDEEEVKNDDESNLEEGEEDNLFDCDSICTSLIERKIGHTKNLEDETNNEFASPRSSRLTTLSQISTDKISNPSSRSIR